MKLVERHVIKRADPRFKVIDRAAFASKNLYNVALYVIRQAFIHEGRAVTYEDLARDLKTSAEYRVLPARWRNGYCDRWLSPGPVTLPPARRGKRTRRSSWGIPNCPSTCPSRVATC